jgi:hypothetical protein
MSRARSLLSVPRPAATLLVAVTVALVAGCSTTAKGPRVYEEEAFDSHAFSREFVASPSDTCGAARRALLSQGYVVQLMQGDQMQAHKRFQPSGETHVQIEFHVNCSPMSRAQPTTVAFVSAVQDRYMVKKTSTAASLGVSPLGSISLPFSSSIDSLVKVASETIAPGRFYDRFFDLVEFHLAEQKGLNGEPTETSGVAPVPAVSPAPVSTPPAGTLQRAVVPVRQVAPAPSVAPEPAVAMQQPAVAAPPSVTLQPAVALSPSPGAAPATAVVSPPGPAQPTAASAPDAGPAADTAAATAPVGAPAAAAAPASDTPSPGMTLRAAESPYRVPAFAFPPPSSIPVSAPARH